MNWQHAQLKYVARFAYGDSLPSTDEEREGTVKVFGSNGPFANFSRANTSAPAIVIGRKGSYGKVNWSQEPCFASDTTFFVDSSTTLQHLRWLFYLLQTLGLDEGTDEAAVPGLNRDDAYSKIVPVPPLPTQHAIAAYLDHETAELDTLIAAKEHLLELLAEKRRTLITHAVTRGLNPKAQLRESGVEWLGKVPEHWEVDRLKFLIFGIDTGFSPQCYNFPAQDREWGVLKTGCVNGGIFHSQENKTLPESVDPPLDLEIKVGDILMSRASGSTDLIGSVALVDSEPKARLLLSDKTFRIRVDPQKCDRKFFVDVMGSFFVRQQILQVVSGAEGLANNIAQTDIYELILPVPPLEEQQAIANYLAQKTAQLDNLNIATQTTSKLLQERRATLITAAVTGHIQIESD